MLWSKGKKAAYLASALTRYPALAVVVSCLFDYRVLAFSFLCVQHTACFICSYGGLYGQACSGFCILHFAFCIGFSRKGKRRKTRRIKETMAREKKTKGRAQE
jgi:hypothetical protein